MHSGYIKWEYLGSEILDGKEAEVLRTSSDTKILSLLNLTSSEKVFLDSENYLPLKVERDVTMFGKQEIIEEIYDQENGQVIIKRTGEQKKTETYTQDKPIHNILALLYFFPDNISFEKGKWNYFNLPTNKIKIKMVKERKLKVGKKEVDTYFLLGRGAKRFSLWLDKKTMFPLRIEFIFPVGKVTITPKD